MTRKERVSEAITFHNTDFVPYNISLTTQAFEKTAEYLNSRTFMENVGNHISGMAFGFALKEVRPGYFMDDFGVVWNRTGVDKDIGVIDNIMIPEPDVEMYDFPEIPSESIRRDCEKTIADKKDTFVAANLVFSLFERAWTLTGMENLLAYMLLEPDFVHKLLRRITDLNIEVLKIYMEYDFDCIHFGDDWGKQKGLIMGPELWRKFIKPYLSEMYDFIKSGGKFISQHSCGDITDVFDDLADIGLNIYQTFQPEIYDIKSVKAKYGGRLSFWGGISTICTKIINLRTFACERPTFVFQLRSF